MRTVNRRIVYSTYMLSSATMPTIIIIVFTHACNYKSYSIWLLWYYRMSFMCSHTYARTSCCCVNGERRTSWIDNAGVPQWANCRGYTVWDLSVNSTRRAAFHLTYHHARQWREWNGLPIFINRIHKAPLLVKYSEAHRGQCDGAVAVVLVIVAKVACSTFNNQSIQTALYCCGILVDGCRTAIVSYAREYSRNHALNFSFSNSHSAFHSSVNVLYEWYIALLSLSTVVVFIPFFLSVVFVSSYMSRW